MPALLIDPKGDLTNLCLTFPEARRDRLPAVGQRGRRHEGRPVGPRLRRRPGEGVDRRSRRLGHRARDRIAALREKVDVHDLHPGLERRRRAEHRRLVAGPVRRQRRRGRRRRDRRLRQRPAEPGRHRRRPAVQPRAHPAVEPHPQRVDRRPQPRPADLRRHGPAAADSQARRVRARSVLPAEGSHGVRDPAQRAARLAVVRRVDDRPATRHRRRC